MRPAAPCPTRLPSLLLAIVALAAGPVGLAGCGDGSGGDGRLDVSGLSLQPVSCSPGDPPPALAVAEDDAGILSAGIDVGQQLCFRAFAADGPGLPGASGDLGSEARWEVHPAGVADVVAPGRISGLAPGEGQVVAVLSDGSGGTVDLIVAEPGKITSIYVAPDDWIERGYFVPLPGPLPLPEPFPFEEPLAVDGPVGAPDVPTFAAALSCAPIPVEPPIVVDPPFPGFPIDDGGGSGETPGSPGVVEPGAPVPVENEPGDDPAVDPAVDPAPAPLPDPGRGAASIAPCFYGRTVFAGDRLPFRATGYTAAGTTVDLTDRVQWTSDDPSVVAVGADGSADALALGTSGVRARLGGVTSEAYGVEVVSPSPVGSLSLEREVTSTVLRVGERDRLHVVAYHDNGAVREVTSEVGYGALPLLRLVVDREGTMLGLTEGRVTLTARLDGVRSNPLELEVWRPETVAFCEDTDPNRAQWDDGLNRVDLESDCGRYGAGATATFLYSVYELVPQPGRYFTPCLDLRILDGSGRTVRTLRDEGCGPQPLAEDAVGAPEAPPLIYQYDVRWDLRDDAGAPVPPGTYVAQGVFVLYYDPVIELAVEVTP